MKTVLAYIVWFALIITLKVTAPAIFALIFFVWFGTCLTLMVRLYFWGY